MAGIEVRRNRAGRVISYRVHWRQDGVKQSETFGDEASAMHFRIDVELGGNRWPAGYVRFADAPAAPAPVPTPAAAAPAPAVTAPTFAEFAERYTQSDYTKAAVEKRLKMSRDLARLGARFASMPMDTITKADVQALLDDLATGAVTRRPLSAKSVKNFRSDLSGVFRYWAAVSGDDDYRTMVPGTVNRGQATDFEAMYVTTAQADAILAALPTDADRAYVTLLLAAGLRSGEARALRVTDLQLEGRLPSVSVERAIKHSPDGNHRLGTPKTRKSRRTLPLDADTVAMLREHVAGKFPLAPVFDLGNDGTWQREHWVPACKRAGFVDKHPRIHDLRGTHASWLLAQGLSIFDVSRRLGHSTIVTTADKYGHLDVSAGAAAAAAIGATWRRG